MVLLRFALEISKPVAENVKARYSKIKKAVVK